MAEAGRNLFTLFTIDVVMAICWYMSGPFIPLFIRSLGASVFLASLVLFTSGVASTMAVILSGFLSDRYGEKKLIIFSALIWGLASILYRFSTTWEEAIPAAIIASLSLSLFLPARMSFIALNAKPSSVATAYGFMNIAWPVGGILGPIMGGFIIKSYGWNSLFYSWIVMALTGMLLSLSLREERDREPTRVRAEKKIRDPCLFKGSIWVLTAFILAHIVGNTARGILNTVMPFYITDIFHRDEADVGLFFSVGLGVATLITQVPSGLLADKLGRKRVMVCAVALTSFMPFLLTLSNDYIIAIILYTVATGLWSMTWPASVAYLMDLAASSRRGFIAGLRQMAVRLGFTVGPIVGGYLWDAIGPMASFYATSIFFAVSLMFLLMLKE